MLRSAASLGLRHGSRMAIANRRSSTLRLSQTTWLQPRSNNVMVQRQIQNQNSQWRRALSSQANKKEDAPKKEGDNATDEETNAIVLTPGQKVVAASRLGMWAGILGFASICAYYIAKELIPTKMSPNTVFNKATTKIRQHPQVARQYGDSIKFYGKDHGGHREGRRNFIEHTQYNDPEDNSKRTRVRFNLEGQHASAFCFAEVTSEMPSGEFVYVLVQDKQSGRVVTVVDNRAALTAKRLAGGNAATAGAMEQLLGRGGSS